ncbi:hypothetical protein PG994_010063 [Apiospora phragmitis]|uniref:Uncharacterized protein n=1 Tax=Apiospora phragmitis TaxID=2905665 RepID=A0ABR1TRH8_9PEZI
MEKSGGDELRIWLRNNTEILTLNQTIELLDHTLDETKDADKGADCIDAWMKWAVERFTPEHINDGFFTARKYGLGDVYMVAWNDADTGLDEMMADIEAKIKMVDGQDGEKAMMKVHNENQDEQEDTNSHDSGTESVSSKSKEEDQLLDRYENLVLEKEIRSVFQYNWAELGRTRGI